MNRCNLFQISGQLRYEVQFIKDEETHPCEAVYECFYQISKWKNAFYTMTSACPMKRIENVQIWHFKLFIKFWSTISHQRCWGSNQPSDRSDQRYSWPNNLRTKTKKSLEERCWFTERQKDGWKRITLSDRKKSFYKILD